MSISSADIAFLSISLPAFGAAIIWLGIALYLAYFRMEKLLSYFQNSPAVTIRKCLTHSGPFGRLHVLRIMMGLMADAKPFLRDGGASAEDLKRIPSNVRRPLIFLYRSGWALLLIFAGLYATVEMVFF